jgi:DNA-binding MarR family transcriptional regulator
MTDASQQLPDTWSRRDLPVLREAARGVDDNPPPVGIRIQEIAEHSNLTVDDVYKATKALEAAGLIEVRWVHPATAGRIVQVSAHARQLVGQWPSEETGLQRMIAALQAIAENTQEDEDTRTRAKKALDAITGTGKKIGLAMAIAYATGQIPGHGG